MLGHPLNAPSDPSMCNPFIHCGGGRREQSPRSHRDSLQISPAQCVLPHRETGVRADRRHRRMRRRLFSRASLLVVPLALCGATATQVAAACSNARSSCVASPRAETRYDALILEYAGRYRVEAALVKAVIRAESGFALHAVSPCGARGLMQLMPSVARSHGVADAEDPRQNIRAGVKHLRFPSFVASTTILGSRSPPTTPAVVRSLAAAGYHGTATRRVTWRESFVFAANTWNTASACRLRRQTARRALKGARKVGKGIYLPCTTGASTHLRALTLGLLNPFARRFWDCPMPSRLCLPVYDALH